MKKFLLGTTTFCLFLHLTAFSQTTEFGVHWGNAVKGTAPSNFTTVNNVLQQSGVKYIRCSFKWKDIQTSPTTFNWYNISKNVDSLLNRGFTIIGMLLGTPSWYTTNNTGNPQYDEFFAPSDTIEWGKFIDSVVTKFKGRVTHWEIWNEPDGPFLIPPPPSGPANPITKANEFHKLLKCAYHRIKLIDPANMVLNGGFSSHICYGSNHLAFLNQVFLNQSYNYFDIMNFHVYDFPYTIRDTLLLKMQTNGIGNMPIWITETNPWRILGANGGNSDTNTANYLCTWINDTLINYFNPNVICWFNLRNWATYLPGVCDNCNPDSTAYGLLDSLYNPTIVLNAYQNCISSVTGMEWYSLETTKTISIFPNPFSTQTTLQTTEQLKNATLFVDNCFGQTVAQIKNINGQTITLHRDNLPTGLYFLRLMQDNKVIAIKKIVIAD